MFKNDKKVKYIIALVCLAFSFLIALQLKSVRINVDNGTARGERTEWLEEQLALERQKTESLSAQIAEYQKDLNLIENESVETEGYLKVLTKRLERAEMLGGLSRVYGPGVEVTIEDSTSKVDSGNAGAYLIHDLDLLRVINELRDAGAEAIDLNGERLIATSEIRCAGSTLSVNNARYSQPYVIRAIGDPKTLENALSMRNGVVDVLSLYGIKTTIVVKDEILVEAYDGEFEFKHAQAATSEEAAE